VTLAHAKQCFLEADAEYNALKQHAPSHRHEFLCDRAANKSGDVLAEAQKAASRML
jgi:hypothetical protein